MSDSDSATGGGFAKLVPGIAGLCGLAGVAVGLLALAGPLMVWFGMGDFRQGIGLLQIANTWALWVAAACVVAAVLATVLARHSAGSSTRKLVSFAVIGAVCAGLTWYVPQTFRPPEGTPVIHDVATDPYDPVEFIAIAPLRADAPNNLDYGVMEGVDSVQQHIDMQQEAYPDIVPQVFDAPVTQVFDEAMAAVDAMGWEIVAFDASTGRIEATDTTFWFRFKDDVAIQVEALETGKTVLQARSVSRLGRGDVGKNAARLREFFALMNKT